uniref:Uncharacterized protein n=1 Tax=Anguilla anguilla TaxID=7936 RepID=A0A0E9T128_ANGAN
MHYIFVSIAFRVKNNSTCNVAYHRFVKKRSSIADLGVCNMAQYCYAISNFIK